MKTKKGLPKLRKLKNKTKKYPYHLKNSDRKRRLAINEGVKYGNKSMKRNATAKKARLNVLRIYRRYKKPHECRLITRDMKYMDKKYGLKKTNDIC
jgi:hypothetical protein